MEKKSKVALALAAVGAARQASEAYSVYKSKYDERMLYVARLDNNQTVFFSMMRWLDASISSRRIKFRTEGTSHSRVTDSGRRTKITIGEHVLSVYLERPDSPIQSYDAADETLVFTSKTKEGIDALHHHLDGLLEEWNTKSRSPRLWTPDTFGGWGGNRDLPHRGLDSVFMPEGQKEELMHDVEHFFEHKARYRIAGIPYHRGYLLYGEPGNGKSSMVSAIANHYRLNLYNLSLSTIKDDKALAEMINRIGEHSLLLIEDIDIFKNSTTRESSGSGGPTLAGLLNALDGVATPDGLITFVTTNHREDLDPALIRPGRLDYQMELKRPVPYQIENMFNHVYGEPLNVTPGEFTSMAQLTNVFKENLNDVEGARLAIKEANHVRG